MFVDKTAMVRLVLFVHSALPNVNKYFNFYLFPQQSKNKQWPASGSIF